MSTWQPIIPDGPMYAFQRDRLHHSAAVRAGHLLIVSGIIGMVDRNVAPDPAEQFAHAFANLRDLLDACGSGLSDVAELLTFHVAYAGHIAAFVAAKDAAFPVEPYPAWTAIGCSELSYGALVEIRAVAAPAAFA